MLSQIARQWLCIVDIFTVAVGRINEIIANGLARQGPKLSRFTTRGTNPPPGPRPPPPPPVMGMNSPNQVCVCLEV